MPTWCTPPSRPPSPPPKCALLAMKKRGAEAFSGSMGRGRGSEKPSGWERAETRSTMNRRPGFSGRRSWFSGQTAAKSSPSLTPVPRSRCHGRHTLAISGSTPARSCVAYLRRRSRDSDHNVCLVGNVTRAVPRGREAPSSLHRSPSDASLPILASEGVLLFEGG